MTTVSGAVVNVTLAVSHFSSFTVQVAAPANQQGTLGPKILRQNLNNLAMRRLLSSVYELWGGSADLGADIIGAVSIKIAANDGVGDVLYLNAGNAGWQMLRVVTPLQQ